MNVISESNIKEWSVGGKAQNLNKLDELGYNIPKWIVIPDYFLLEQLSFQKDGFLEENSFEKLKVKSIIQDQLAHFFGHDFEQKSFAVRSSVIDEDGTNHSFAGLFESHLHIKSQDLEINILKVWRSVYTERVRVYREQRDLPMRFGIAVIVQEMLNPEVSGVAFGIDPVKNDPETKIISTVYGLGEGLVSGELDADTFSVKNALIKESLAKKEFEYVKAPLGGIVHQKVEEFRVAQASLSREQVLFVVSVLEDLENKLGQPQDIEFAFEKEQFFLLQTRPITSNKLDQIGEYTLWDNSNIVESYPGITTPLTFSFIIKMYEMVYRQFVGIMGVREKEIEEYKSVFANTLGLVRGRVYYNLLSWYKMLAMVPGYSINAENMERMMGVKEKFDLGDQYKMSKSLAWIRIVQMVWNMLSLLRNLPKERRRFMAHLQNVMTIFQRCDFSKMSVKEIVEKYNDFEKSLLLEWKAPLINDFFAMIFFGMLEKQTKNICPDQENLHNDLLCGSQDIISVEPIRKTIEISKWISENEKVNDFVQGHSAEEIWLKLLEGDFVDLKIKIEDYIFEFGERCVGELKLETISYSQKPELFVNILKSYVEQGVSSRVIHSNLEEDLRSAAIDKIEEALKGKFLKRKWFYYVLNKTRDLVSNRENLRYERTRGFGMVRKMFSEIGKKLYHEGVLKDERDVFYLDLSDIKSLECKPLESIVVKRIHTRKKEFATYYNQVPPEPRFFTYGNDFKDEFIYSLDKIEEAVEDLKGIGCCPGIVKGRVRIILNPQEIGSLNGDILVTTSTDPGWVTLFPTVGAIIVERGSLLSHSAIVSREMGIPCIVGVTGLLRSVKSGDLIQMDGSTGQIKVIEYA